MENIDTIDSWNHKELDSNLLGKFAARLEALSDVEL